MGSVESRRGLPAAREGKRAAQSQSYEPTSRGGFCYSALVVTEDLGDYPLASGLDAMSALTRLADLCAAAKLEEAIRLAAPPRFIGLNLDAMREGMRLAE